VKDFDTPRVNDVNRGSCVCLAKMIGACGVSKLLHNDENLISNLKPGFITLFVACDFCIRDYTLLKARTKRNKRTSLIVVRIVEKPLTSPQESVHWHTGTIQSSCSADKR
jgi:hypothetical protein